MIARLKTVKVKDYLKTIIKDCDKWYIGKMDDNQEKAIAIYSNKRNLAKISNFKNHYTGHMYFTLKDENSLIKCIMFKTYAQKLNFMPKDGMKVIVLGGVSVFEIRYFTFY